MNEFLLLEALGGGAINGQKPKFPYPAFVLSRSHLSIVDEYLFSIFLLFSFVPRPRRVRQ